MSIYNKKNIAVVGATGYTGLDLILMLSKHPKIKIKYLCATKNLGKKISVFDKRIKKSLPKITSVKKVNWNNLDLVFLTLSKYISDSLSGSMTADSPLLSIKYEA